MIIFLINLVCILRYNGRKTGRGLGTKHPENPNNILEMNRTVIARNTFTVETDFEDGSTHLLGQIGLLALDITWYRIRHTGEQKNVTSLHLEI